jgi:hypothetical protein
MRSHQCHSTCLMKVASYMMRRSVYWMSSMITSRLVCPSLKGVCSSTDANIVNHLQNMTNTLIFPQFPGLWSRRPEVNLQQTPSDDSLASVLFS